MVKVKHTIQILISISCAFAALAQDVPPELVKQFQLEGVEKLIVLGMESDDLAIVTQALVTLGYFQHEIQNKDQFRDGLERHLSSDSHHAVDLSASLIPILYGTGKETEEYLMSKLGTVTGEQNRTYVYRSIMFDGVESDSAYIQIRDKISEPYSVAKADLLVELMRKAGRSDPVLLEIAVDIMESEKFYAYPNLASSVADFGPAAKQYIPNLEAMINQLEASGNQYLSVGQAQDIQISMGAAIVMLKDAVRKLSETSPSK